MHGNVWEWVQDLYVDNDDQSSVNGNVRQENDHTNKLMRVLRGGSWQTSAAGCRCASRSYYPQISCRNSSRIGLRLLKEV